MSGNTTLHISLTIRDFCMRSVDFTPLSCIVKNRHLLNTKKHLQLSTRLTFRFSSFRYTFPHARNSKKAKENSSIAEKFYQIEAVKSCHSMLKSNSDWLTRQYRTKWLRITVIQFGSALRLGDGADTELGLSVFSRRWQDISLWGKWAFIQEKVENHWYKLTQYKYFTMSVSP